MGQQVQAYGIQDKEQGVSRTEQLDVETRVAQALGAIGAGEGYRTISVRGYVPGTVGFNSLLGVVDGVVNGLGDLEPPRELVGVQYLDHPGAGIMDVIISTRPIA